MKIHILIPTILSLIAVTVVKSQEAVPIDPVHKIIVSDGILLEIERSDNYFLTVRSEKPDPECVISEVSNGVLTLKKVSSLKCSGKVTARLVCPSVRELEISGSAEVTTFNVMKTDSLKIKQRSGGKSFIDLDVKYLQADLGEGSILTGSGYANIQRIDVTTNATFSGFGLEGEDIEIVSSLGGKGKICASEILKANSKMGGYISYKCNPAKTEIEKKGNGVVEMMQDTD